MSTFRLPWLRYLTISQLVICFLISSASGLSEASEFDDGDDYKIIVEPLEFEEPRTIVKRAVPKAPYGLRPGSPTKTHSCKDVRAVPAKLRNATEIKPNGIPTFYQKYTEAYNIPVIASKDVPEDALRRACYVLRFLLAGNSKVREWFYRLSGRIGVVGVKEKLTLLPEYSKKDESLNWRARGLGGTPSNPISTNAEENILCYKKDRWHSQDILIHEASHGVHLIGAAFGMPNWDTRLRLQYRISKKNGLWNNTYSMADAREYFGKASQIYFNVSTYSKHPDGVRGPIDTRPKLKTYDPPLYELMQEIYPCDNKYLKRCTSTRAQEEAQVLEMDCDLKMKDNNKADCTDEKPSCFDWAYTNKFCDDKKYGSFMKKNCRLSCNLCH